ncbi:MAG: porin [Pseudomonadota bacterium]
MSKRQTALLPLALALSATGMTSHASGITVYKGDNGEYVKMGGRIQLQYHSVDPDGGQKTDKVFFRRLRPFIEGSLHKDWKAKFQFDLGDAEDENEVAIKDAYFEYKGFENMEVTVGNAYFPFSREDMTSSKHQQLVERTFVGDHNYGSPERNAGIHLTGHSGGKMIGWGASFASASIDPDATKIDFDTPVNTNSDFNEGWIYGGRLDYYPLGYFEMKQGDFDNSELKVAVGVAAFGWNNDDDNNTYTTGGVSTSATKADLDTVTGYEISGAVRVAGFSVDAEYNKFTADTVDPAFTGGVFVNGTTDLDNWSVEGGYMVIPAKLELVAGYQSQDADGYADKWNRTSIGANWFFHKDDAKVQLTYQMGENLNGVTGADANEIFLQGQFVF